MSFLSGMLLLAFIAQSAFGYALVEPGRVPSLRDVHRALAILLLAGAVWLGRTAARLPYPGRRTDVLRVGARVLLSLVALQWLLGLTLLGWLPLPWAVRDLHIGVGLAATFLVLAVHMTSIWPSVRLGAQQEWHGSWRGGEQDPDRKL